jgi:hypothetical protein
MQLDLKHKTHALGARAKHAGRIAKLTMALNAEQEAIQNAYVEIGRLYYETHCDDSDPLLSQLCAEVRAANDRIADMQREMDTLRSALRAEG